MQIVIVGGGRMGFSLAQQLDEEGHQVVVVDRDPRMVERARTRLDVLAVNKSGLQLRSIDEDSVRDADVLIAATGSDEVNIITCILARELGIPRHIARLQSAELYRELGDLDRMTLGVDHFVNPDLVTVDRLKTVVTSVGTTESAEFADGAIVLRALLVEDNSPITKLPIKDLHQEYEKPFVVTAVKRDMSLFVPGPETIIAAEDTIYAVLRADDLAGFLDAFGFRKKTTERIVVFGASPVGQDLCTELEPVVRDIVLIEPDEELCLQAAERLANTSVIVGSPLDQAVLEDLKVEGADYFLALSSSDEANLSAAMMGKRMGVRTTVMLTSQPKHVELFEPLRHVDTVVSPILLSVGEILRTVREGRVLSLYKVAGQRGEALEVEVQEGALVEGKVVKELELPGGILISALISKDGDVKIPDGDTIIHAGDRVVLVGLMAVIDDALSFFTKQ